MSHGALWLRYHIDAPLDHLAIPDPAASERVDDLWQHLCCELFLRRPDDEAYLELNFSPSSQWAAYRFSAYRAGREGLALPATPQILLDASDTHLALEVEVALPVDWRDGPLLADLSAIIEEVDGTKSYWALRHPPGPPDFHHPDCFALSLEAPPPT
ncbi:MAG: hypothetical protein CVT74_00420 [Alphaproteobacteria bacterium HGW-Alphaproteobacteria-13]|nr:MAG: hypothetical protein CVT74_00420 [Alphaproteobacteria bacterium HGW-Alphaproteobacteria-13]